MDPQFSKDYEGPASFYKLLSERCKSNPMVLPRLLKKAVKRKHPNQLNIRLTGVCPSKSGVISVAVARVKSLNNIVIDLEIDSNHLVCRSIHKNESIDWNVSMQCDWDSFNDCIVKSNEDYHAGNSSKRLKHIFADSVDDNCVVESVSHVLAVIYKSSDTSPSSISNVSLKQGLSFQDLIKQRLFALFSPNNDTGVNSGSSATASVDSLSLCVMDMLPTCVKQSSRSKDPKLGSNSASASPRHYKSWLWPVSSSRQIIALTTRPKPPITSSIVQSKILLHRNDLFAEIEVNWTSTDNLASQVIRDDKCTELDRKSSSFAINRLHIDTSHSNDLLSQLPTVIPPPPLLGLYFHYLYHDLACDQLKPIIEYKSRVECPWCDFHAADGEISSNINHASSTVSSVVLDRTVDLGGVTGVVINDANPIIASPEVNDKLKQSLAVLMHHLATFHQHFTYSVPILDPQSSLHVVVKRDRSDDLDSQSILKESLMPFVYSARNQRRLLFQLGKIPSLVTSSVISTSLSHNVSSSGNFVPRPSNRSRSLKERDKSSNSVSSEVKLTAARAVRQYYHSRLGLPLAVDEDMSYDSDIDDIDETLDLVSRNKALDEFEDVSFEEKEFMKLWNTHMNTANPYSDSYVTLECRRFAVLFADEIINKNLRHNFLLHLMNMWDFGLLRHDEVLSYIKIVDKHYYARQFGH